jgi:hypothetical protein
MSPRFHLAFPVTDLDTTRRFYVDQLGATAGRATDTWVDFDLYGHQLSAHRVSAMPAAADIGHVDGREVPIPHFGLVLEWDQWQAMIDRLRAQGTRFLVEPLIRFQGQPAEQGTFFVADPDGNALEFKALRDVEQLFA